MTKCLKENMGIRFCDYIEEDILKLVCRQEFDPEILTKNQTDCLNLVGWERQHACLDFISMSSTNKTVTRESELDRT